MWVRVSITISVYMILLLDLGTVLHKYKINDFLCFKKKCICRTWNLQQRSLNNINIEKLKVIGLHFFSYNIPVRFIGIENKKTGRKSQTDILLSHSTQYASERVRIKIRIFVATDTDYIGRCISNYHKIMIMMALFNEPLMLKVEFLIIHWL